jgi:hypothetical protein
LNQFDNTLLPMPLVMMEKEQSETWSGEKQEFFSF